MAWPALRRLGARWGVLFGICACGIGLALYLTVRSWDASPSDDCLNVTMMEPPPASNAPALVQAERIGELDGQWENIYWTAASPTGRFALVCGEEAKTEELTIACFDVSKRRPVARASPKFGYKRCRPEFHCSSSTVLLAGENVVDICRVPSLEFVARLPLAELSPIDQGTQQIAIDPSGRFVAVVRGPPQFWDVGAKQWSSVDLIDRDDGRFLRCVIAAEDRKLPNGVPCTLRRNATVTGALFLDDSALAVTSVMNDRVSLEVFGGHEWAMVGRKESPSILPPFVAKWGRDGVMLAFTDRVTTTLFDGLQPVDHRLNTVADRKVVGSVKDFVWGGTPLPRAQVHHGSGAMLMGNAYGLLATSTGQVADGNFRDLAISHDGTLALELVGRPSGMVWRVALWRISCAER